MKGVATFKSTIKEHLNGLGCIQAKSSWLGPIKSWTPGNLNAKIPAMCHVLRCLTI